MADPVPAWDRAARASWITTLRSARSRLATAGTALAQARRYGDVMAVEAAIGRLARLIDQVESGGQRVGRWASAAGVASSAPVAALNRTVTDVIAELARTVDMLATHAADPGLAVVDGLVVEIERALATRQAALVADEPPVLAAPTLAEARPGDRVSVEGRDYAVVDRTRWRRGDASVVLAHATLRLELWQDPADGVALFESGPPVGVTPEPPRLEVDGTEYLLRWRDDGGGTVSGAGGRSWRAGPRWLYASGDGILLWLEAWADAVHVSRGLPVLPGDLHWSGEGP